MNKTTDVKFVNMAAVILAMANLWWYKMYHMIWKQHVYLLLLVIVLLFITVFVDCVKYCNIAYM